jgi:hypothetical protein
VNLDKNRRKGDLTRKFRSFADRLLPSGRTESILNFVENIEHEQDIGKLVALFQE